MVKLINQRDPQTSTLAIHLLDNLVKNCGFPFHLQISTVEFLNELVKRFPERPHFPYSKIQRLILAQIAEWYQTICKTSKYREEFHYIRDMHRLLSSKGYVFPEVKVEDAAVLNPSETIKTLRDIQKEEAIVHSAKLQELIRRGKPNDLQEANKLMKIMAGFKDDNVEENKKQISEDIARLKRKGEIFAEMLNAIESSGSKIDDSNETLIELYSAIKGSQPIIGKIMEEEHDNEEYVNDLLAMNDFINQLIEKFQLLKGGQTEEASKIKVKGDASSASTAKELNLIDFGDEPSSGESGAQEQQGYQDLLSELSNLAFTDSVSLTQQKKVNPMDFFGSGGSISLGDHSNGVQQPVPTSSKGSAGGSSSNNIDLLGDFASPSPQLQSNTAKQLDPFGFDFPATTHFQNSEPTVKRSSLFDESERVTLEIETLSDSTSTYEHGYFYVSSKENETLSNLKLMVAAAKGCKLDLKPQSSNTLRPYEKRGFHQEFFIENPSEKPLKFKWKLEFFSGGQAAEEGGVVNLSV